MTDVVFFKNSNIIYGFTCSGHTGYSDYGKDIVCSALSSITQSCALGLKKVVGIKLIEKRNDEEGYYSIELPKNITNSQLEQSQILLKTLFLSVKDLIKGYSKFIKLEERDYVY